MLSKSNSIHSFKTTSIKLYFQPQFTYKKKIFEKYQLAEIVRKKGADLCRDPFFNKGTAFSYTERDRLDLRGLIPSSILPIEKQNERDIQEFYKGWAERAAQNPDDEIIKSGVSPDNIRKWRFLDSLQNRNIHQFYQIIQSNFEDMAPIIYTPTVGWVCQNYSTLFKRPRGMFFSKYDKGEMNSMIYNWESNDIDAVVITDGSRVLGLGDLGVGGMGISVGKLDLYIAAAGFHPRRVLPIVMDVGTNNKKLLEDPFYLGVREKRIGEDEYYPLIDEMMAAILKRWPKALIQFEDFDYQHALPILKRYRDDYLVFNDDIQGTAATALSGIMGALRVQGLPLEALKKQRIVCVGAGSAGGGVLKAISYAMHELGMTFEEASKQFWVLDKDGLVTKQRQGLTSRIRTFARDEQELEGQNLLSVIRQVKPTVLIGLTAVGGIFTDQVLTEFSNLCPQRPIIFPLSNPTSRSECTAEQAARCSKGKAIFASGSPFKDVVYEGRLIKSSQCNNRYIFPGLAKGAWLGQIGTIDNKELMAAAKAVSELISEEELKNSCVFPQLTNIRDISAHLAARVIEVAHEQGKLDNIDAKKALDLGFENLKSFIKAEMWWPTYKPLVYMPPGVGE